MEFRIEDFTFFHRLLVHDVYSHAHPPIASLPFLATAI